MKHTLRIVLALVVAAVPAPAQAAAAPDVVAEVREAIAVKDLDRSDAIYVLKRELDTFKDTAIHKMTEDELETEIQKLLDSGTR